MELGCFVALANERVVQLFQLQSSVYSNLIQISNFKPTSWKTCWKKRFLIIKYLNFVIKTQKMEKTHHWQNTAKTHKKTNSSGEEKGNVVWSGCLILTFFALPIREITQSWWLLLFKLLGRRRRKKSGKMFRFRKRLTISEQLLFKISFLFWHWELGKNRK